MKKAVILSSGGLDSSVCLALAVEKYKKKNVLALNIFYGQRHIREMEASQKICEHYGVEREELDLSLCFYKGCSSLLSSSNEEISIGTYHEQLSSGELRTVVPFRNGLFLSAASSFALGKFPKDEIVIILGNHGGDVEHNEYADCSQEFCDAMNIAIQSGTSERVSLFSPFVGRKKSEIVKEGIRLHVPFELTWSCYNGKDRPCMRCATCLQRIEAFKSNGMEDPLLLGL